MRSYLPDPRPRLHPITIPVDSLDEYIGLRFQECLNRLKGEIYSLTSKAQAAVLAKGIYSLIFKTHVPLAQALLAVL